MKKRGLINMYELIQVSKNDFYIESPSKIGIVKIRDNEVCFIDSGSDKDAGRKARQILEVNNWKLTAIYTTHSHADHIGGNKYLQTQTGCKIYAPGVEWAMSQYPILEPYCLWGSMPVKELTSKFFLAQESHVDKLSQEYMPKGFEIIPLPGHTMDMVGYKTPDGNIFPADALSSEATLNKYKITYINDIKSYLETLEKIKTMDAEVFIPSHTDAYTDIKSLVQYNIDKVNEITEVIKDICNKPTCYDALMQQLFSRFNLHFTIEQYSLVGSTVKGYISYLKEEGRLAPVTDNNMLCWKTI